MTSYNHHLQQITPFNSFLNVNVCNEQFTPFENRNEPLSCFQRYIRPQQPEFWPTNRHVPVYPNRNIYRNVAPESESYRYPELNVVNFNEHAQNNDCSAPPQLLGNTESVDNEKKHKKIRTRTQFTAHQLWRLESVFQKNHYLQTSERSQLAAELGLCTMRVKTWFQNRRNKFRKEQTRHNTQLPVSVNSQVLPPFMYHY